MKLQFEIYPTVKYHSLFFLRANVALRSFSYIYIYTHTRAHTMRSINIRCNQQSRQKSPIFQILFKAPIFLPLLNEFTLDPSPIFVDLLMSLIEGQLLSQLRFSTFYKIYFFRYLLVELYNLKSIYLVNIKNKIKIQPYMAINGPPCRHLRMAIHGHRPQLQVSEASPSPVRKLSTVVSRRVSIVVNIDGRSLTTTSHHYI